MSQVTLSFWPSTEYFEKTEKIVERILESIIVNIDTKTAWKVSKYGVFSGLYFRAFGLNTGKYRPEKTPYVDTFHTVKDRSIVAH